MSRLLTVGAFVTLTLILSESQTIKGVGKTADPADFLSRPVDFETKTNFKDHEEVVRTPLTFGTDYLDDSDREWGFEERIQEGVKGEKIKTYRVTVWQGREVYRVLSQERTVSPINQKIRRGVKVVWREINTNDGLLKYWRKMKVFATAYDPNCPGCLGRTYSGTPVQVGTCAVDPKVIVMGSHFYVPGYGICSALDIGGAIKGNRIDLGFPDIKQSWWITGYVEIYLLDGIPKN